MNEDLNISPVPYLQSYTEKQIQDFFNFSPISKVYHSLINDPNVDNLYRFRHQCWLEVALSNFYQFSNQQSRSLYWSNSMDQIVKRVFEMHFEPEDQVLILALGKYGSQVLNLSSDIDILILTDQTITTDKLKKTRSFVQHLNAKTQYGFLTRVDLNLKPTDQQGVLTNTTHLTNYLWSSRELWERLVYTRARIICGNLSDETSLKNEIQKFCYRKYIRLDLVEGLSELLTKILKSNSDPLNIKLCAGGIRTVELLLSSIQLLYGGRDRELQTHSTYQVFEKIKKNEILRDIQIDSLLENYNVLRSLEDQAQSILDEQTHTAKIQNISDENILEKKLIENQSIINSFLNKLFKNNDFTQSELMTNLIKLKEFYPHIDAFLKFLNKNSSYISLFESHPKSYDNLLKALVYSPQVSKLILLRPDLLDMFLIKSENISIDLDDESFLISLSDFKSISQITAIGEFLTSFNTTTLLEKTSKTADVCVTHLLKRVFKNYDVDLLKLGKWSSSELGINSDLDFVFISEEPEDMTKLVRKFINYLTHNTFHGPFYNIDLRLRPSGQAGPILSSKIKLLNFLSQSSSIWQRQAYLRNQYLISEKSFEFNPKPMTLLDQNELVEIRNKRLQKHYDKALNLKEGLGGLVDSEFLVQSLFLSLNKKPKALKFQDLVAELVDLNQLSFKDSSLLIKNYNLIRTLEQLLEVLSKGYILTEESFGILSRVENFNLLNEVNIYSFSDVLNFVNESQKLIERLHPFINK